MSNMTANVVAAVVIIAIVALAIKGAIPHFKGQGACCGGGSSLTLIKPKRLKNVIAIKKIVIEGMVCDHCSGRIHNALNSIEGVSARVNRSKGQAFVKQDRVIDEEILRRAVEDLGYKVTEIRE